MALKEDILKEAKLRGIDPYTTPFKPSDLGLKASDYGSFSDHCSSFETESGKYADDIILSVVEKDKNNRPLRYLLIEDLNLMSKEDKDLKLEELKLMSDDYRYREQVMVNEFGLSMTAIAFSVNAAFNANTSRVQLLVFGFTSIFSLLIANHMTRLNVDRLSAGRRRKQLLNLFQMHQPHMGFERKQVFFTFPAPISMVVFCWLTFFALIATVSYIICTKGF